MFTCPLLFSPVYAQRVLGYEEISMLFPNARAIGLFDPGKPHANISHRVHDADLYKRWKEWINLESTRRIAWMLYLFDTLSIIETGSQAGISFFEVATFPLPVPDTIWQAQTAQEWERAMRMCPHTTLNTAMRDHFSTCTSSTTSPPGCETSTDMNTLLLRNDFGMFARLIMVVTLLRGLILLAQGDPQGGEFLHAWGVNLTACVNGKNTLAKVKAYGHALSKVSTPRLVLDVSLLICFFQ